MFNPHQHQQQQQQFHQHLRQLQQLFQHQTPPPPPPPPPPPQPPPAHHIPHHHQGGRPITVAAPAPPPPRMVNLCSAPQTLIAPNPMLQGALLMQQMQAGSMRGFAMGGQQFPQFFSPGSRTSLLGPVPMGVAIKTPHMGFPRHFSPHARYFNSDFQARQPDRKRENEQRSAGNSDNHSESSRSRDESSAVADPACQSSEQPDEPAAKKRKTDGSEESLDTEAAQNSDDKSPDAAAATQEQGRSGAYDADAAADADQRTVVEQIDSTESSVKDPEQQNTDSQDDVTGSNSAAEGKEPAESAAESPLTARDPEELTDGGGEASNKFICYICNITCHNQQNFQSHMNGLSHQQKMMEIQHMSNACLVTLLPRVQESLQGTRKDGEKRPGLQRWCSTCQTHFTTNVTDHRRTEEHKRCSVSSSSTCTVCKQHFRTSREFVMHMQSAEHKQRAEQLWRSSGKEALDELNAEMFMGEEDGDISSEEREDEENGKEGLFGHMEVTLEDLTEEEEFDPDIVYGSSFVVPVAGFVCRLCNHFYHFESSARHTHCKTLKHFQNLKRYKALKKHEDSGSASGEPTDQQNQQNLSPEETSDREPHFTSPDSLIPKSAPEDTPLPSGSVISSHPTANQKTSSCQAPPPPNQQSKPEEDQPDVNAEEEPVTGEPEEEEEEDGPVHAPEGKPSRGRGRTAAKRRGRGGRRR